MKLSRRSTADGSVSRVAAAHDAARGTARAIDLTLSNPTRAGLDYAIYGPESALGGLLGTYDPDPLGLESARLAIAEQWPLGQARADRLLLLPSSSEAYHYVFTLLCDDGDDVLVPEPSYPLLAHLCQYAGVRLTPYRLAYDGAWHIDLDSVRRARGPRTRAVVLISPNNPTGSYTSPAELAALAELDLPLVSDEVFARYAFEPRRQRLETALGATGALTFCIDGLSKSAGLPQVKLSWVALSGPDALVRESMQRLAWLADTYLSVATPVQRALPELLRAAPRFRAGLLQRLRRNRDALRACLLGSAASLLDAEGGWYAVVRLPDIESEDGWVLGLLEREQVLVHPGYFYDFSAAAPHVVLSLLPPEDVFESGARALRRELERQLTTLEQRASL